MKYSVHPEVGNDLDEAALHLELHASPKTAARLIAEYERVAALLVQSPGIGTPMSRGRRIHPLKVFKYSVVYRIVEGTVREQGLLDPFVDKALDKEWPLHRLDATVRAILRAATFELFFMDKVPARVAISEYVDVADAFFDGGDEPRFINGVLNTIARSRRPEEFSQ